MLLLTIASIGCFENSKPKPIEKKNPLQGTWIDSKGQKKKTPEAVAAYFDWVKKNTINFDPRILIPDSSTEDGIVPDKYIYNRVTYSSTQRDAHIAPLLST